MVFLLIVIHVPGVSDWAQLGAVVATTPDCGAAWTANDIEAAASPSRAAATGETRKGAKTIDCFL